MTARSSRTALGCSMAEGCLQGRRGFKPGSHRSRVPSVPKAGQGCCGSSPSCFLLGHCTLQPQLSRCCRCCPWPGSSLRFARRWSGILVGSRCLLLLAHVGAVHSPAKNTGRVHTRQAELGHIPPPMETRCIGLWDKILSQKSPMQVCLRLCGRLGKLPALGRVHVCLSCPGLAGGSRLFQSPRFCRAGAPQETLGKPSPTAGAAAHTTHAKMAPHMPKSHPAVGQYCRKDGRRKKWTLQGEHHGSAAGAVPAVQAWRQVCGLSPACHLRMLGASLR